MGSRRPHTVGTQAGQYIPLQKLQPPRNTNRGRRIHLKIFRVETEIVNCIINEAFSLAPSDLPALLSYGLISRQWLPHSRYLYFSHRQYEFKAGYEFPEWKEENDELSRLLRPRTSTLKGSMLNMSVKGSDEICGKDVMSSGNREDYMYLNRIITYQISVFVNLRSLTLRCMHWVLLQPDAIAALMQLENLSTLALEKVKFKDLDHLYETLLHHFSKLEELRLLEINFDKSPSRSSTEPRHKLSAFPRLRRLEVDMDPRLLPLLDTRCLPSACEYLGFREITSVAHLLKIKALVQHAGSDLRHLKLDIQEPIPYLLVDFTRNDNLRHLDVSYCSPFTDDQFELWSLGWLTEAINTIVSPHFCKLDLMLWFLPLLLRSIPHLDLPQLQEALTRKLVSANDWRSYVQLTFLQTRRTLVSDLDTFIFGVRKQMPMLHRQRRLGVAIEH